MVSSEDAENSVTCCIVNLLLAFSCRDERGWINGWNFARLLFRLGLRQRYAHCARSRAEQVGNPSPFETSSTESVDRLHLFHIGRQLQSSQPKHLIKFRVDAPQNRFILRCHLLCLSPVSPSPAVLQVRPVVVPVLLSLFASLEVSSNVGTLVGNLC